MSDYSTVKKCPADPLKAGYTQLSELVTTSRDEEKLELGIEKITEYMLGHPGFPAEFREQFCKMDADNRTLFFVKTEVKDDVLKYLGSKYDYDEIFPVIQTTDNYARCDVKYIINSDNSSDFAKFKEFVETPPAKMPLNYDTKNWSIIPTTKVDDEVIAAIRTRFETGPKKPIFLKSSRGKGTYYIARDQHYLTSISNALVEAKSQMEDEIAVATKNGNSDEVANIAINITKIDSLLGAIQQIQPSETYEILSTVNCDSQYILRGDEEVKLYEEYKAMDIPEVAKNPNVEEWAIIRNTQISPELIIAIRAAIEADILGQLRGVHTKAYDWTIDLFKKRRSTVHVLLKSQLNNNQYFIMRDAVAIEIIATRLEQAMGSIQEDINQAKLDGNFGKVNKLNTQLEEVSKFIREIRDIKNQLKPAESFSDLLMLCFLGFGVLSPLGHLLVKLFIEDAALQKRGLIGDWWKNRKAGKGDGLTPDEKAEKKAIQMDPDDPRQFNVAFDFSPEYLPQLFEFPALSPALSPSPAAIPNLPWPLSPSATPHTSPTGAPGEGRNLGHRSPIIIHNDYLPEAKEVLTVVGLGLLAFFGVKAAQKGAPALLEWMATREGAAIATAGGIALFSLPALATELKENIESGKTTVGGAVKGYAEQLEEDYIDGFDFWRANGGVAKTLSELEDYAHRAAEDKFVESYEFLDKNGVLASYGEAAGYAGELTVDAGEAIIDGIINIF